jgi:hypothetical protein
MLADIAQHLDPVQFRQPRGVVEHDGVRCTLAIAQHLCEHAADARLVGLDLRDAADRAHLVLAGGVTDHGGAAAHQRDRLVAGLLQPVQHHHGQEVADMQRWCGAVVPDIGGRLALGRERVQSLEVRALVNEAALLQHIQKIGFKCSHLCATLTIVVLHFGGILGVPREPGCRRQWCGEAL